MQPLNDRFLPHVSAAEHAFLNLELSDDDYVPPVCEDLEPTGARSERWPHRSTRSVAT